MILYGHDMNQSARSFTKKLNEKISPLGLFSSQWGIVLYLHKKRNVLKYIRAGAQTVTRTLARMEDMHITFFHMPNS
jgi:hypothetical protein